MNLDFADSNSQSNNYDNSNSTRRNTSRRLAPLKKYWCHLCKKPFFHIYDKTIDTQCIYCDKTFCEILHTDNISDQSHPINFTPYVVNETNNNNNINNNTSNNLLNNNENGFLEEIEENGNDNNDNRNIRNINGVIFNIISSDNPLSFLSPLIRTNLTFQYEDNFENIINEIMLNDTNKYGNPPAAKNAVEKLKKCKINEKIIKEFGIENSCAVCKDEFIVGEECMLMPCNHHFHENCLIPWLKERNSCPVCRYELPTDDEDFELRKKQKLINNNENINNDNVHG